MASKATTTQYYLQRAQERIERLENTENLTEDEAIALLAGAYNRLIALGWRQISECPKDGSVFDAIDFGSTGINETAWIDGKFYGHEGGFLSEVEPGLFKPKSTMATTA